jgi:hypothetical protein
VGLFDTVRCEFPLPDPSHQELDFQTKDLDCLLEEYTITRDGRLIRYPRGRLFEPGRARAVDWPIHGDLRMYDSIERPGREGEWVEYLVRFTDGRVQWVRRLAQREPESEPPRVQVGQPQQPGYRSEHPLRPSVEGRRLTADEFIAHTPEKLELVDGAIPGGEELLLLLLRQFGLRQVAALVGREAWEAALED